GATGRLSSAGATIEVVTGTPMPASQWYRVWLSADPATGRVLIGQHALDGSPVTAEASASGLTLPARGTLQIGRDVTGKLEDPAVLRGFLTAWPDVGAPLEALPGLLAGWDFSRGIDTLTIHDLGPQACHGELVNMPSRAMVGIRWTGREQCWRHAPRD